MITNTFIEGLFVYEPKVFGDQRGYFFEGFNKKRFQEESGLTIEFVQDNQSKSSFGVLRGLHFQTKKAAQSKLVRVLSGTVLDVVVDIRKNSATFGKSFSIILSEENKKQLFIPRGLAHGFVVLSPTAEFFYKCDNYYSPQDESGIFYADSALKIDWQIAENQLIISEKDQKLDTLENMKDFFVFE
ncbi:MAG: dTDP-4-dehydrorhamnose 3,5-epimerase [Bacteroidetes bacterium]|nr:MAG: dTDP-4-dehydrorhamnose 3,5-epimerase [Bacteroidota bacterium]